MGDQIVRSPHSRVFLTQGGAGPANTPLYSGYGRAGAPSQAFGDLTPVYAPSASDYDKFDVVDTIQGQRDLPQMPIDFYQTFGLSLALEMAQQGCPIEIHVHQGACKNPSDFDRGYQRALVFQSARITNWSANDLGAYGGDQNEPIMETVDTTAMNMFQLTPVTAGLVGGSVITDEIQRIIFVDKVTCGDCGIPSNGTNVALALQAESSGSPGIGPAIIYTKDGGANWTKRNIASAAVAETAVDIGVFGSWLVVAAGGSNDRLHYCNITDFLNAEETWATVTTGIVAAGSPKAFVPIDRLSGYLLGDGGYVYFIDQNVPQGVDLLSSGGTTTANLIAGHSYDTKSAFFVGATNVILATDNKGQSFRLLSGPSAKAAVQINAVYAWTANTLLIGYNDGSAYYSVDGGRNWVAASVDPVSIIYDIKGSNDTVLWMAVKRTDGTADVFRSINGGNSFVAIGDVNNSNFPSADHINAIAATPDNVNVVFAGGLAADDEDGVIAKLAGPSAS